MAKINKLYERLIESRSQITFRDFEALLIAFGFIFVRQKGSHRSYKHPQALRLMVIQPKGKEAKDYQVRQFLDMVQEYGLNIGDA